MARREFLCTECDWIGSPAEEPTECPNCCSGALEDITVPGEDE